MGDLGESRKMLPSRIGGEPTDSFGIHLAWSTWTRSKQLNLSLGIVCRVYTKGPGYLGRDAFSSCMPTIWLWSTIERSTFTDFPPGRIAHNRSLLLHVFVCVFICKIKERYHTRAVPDDTMFPAHGNWQASLLFEVSSLDLLAK